MYNFVASQKSVLWRFSCI